ncbi:MAG: hypothetical protein ABIH49_01360 [archaeon]
MIPDILAPIIEIGLYSQVFFIIFVFGFTFYMFYLFIKTGEYIYLIIGITLFSMTLIETYYRILRRKSFWFDY